MPWLYRVVRNGAISAGRGARRRQAHETAAAQQAGVWFDGGEDVRIDAELAARCLEALPLEQREVIVARLWGGLSFQEIGELVGTSSSTAHRWYEAGLQALRERLEPSCPRKTNQTN
jgi:RNA polymerase sigma-70 factor (ECF subfamily)